MPNSYIPDRDTYTIVAIAACPTFTITEASATFSRDRRQSFRAVISDPINTSSTNIPNNLPLNNSNQFSFYSGLAANSCTGCQ